MRLFKAQFFVNVITQVVLSFLFLTIFFLTYVKKKEKESLEKSIDFLFESFVGDISFNLVPQEHFDKINNNNNTNNDSIVDENNKKVVKKVINVLLILILLLILLNVICFVNKDQPFFSDYSLKEIIKNGLIGLVFVGVTEFCFLQFFASRYINIDTNLIKSNLVQKFKEYANS